MNCEGAATKRDSPTRMTSESANTSRYELVSDKCTEWSLSTHTLQKRITRIPRAIRNLMSLVASNSGLFRPKDSSLGSTRGGDHTKKSFLPDGAPSSVISSTCYVAHSNID